MERLDKLLASTGRWSRREVKGLVRAGRVLVDGVPAAAPEQKLDPALSQVLVDGEAAVLRKYTYVMMNKPARMSGRGRSWTCSRRSCGGRGCFRWGGWTRTARGC